MIVSVARLHAIISEELAKLDETKRSDAYAVLGGLADVSNSLTAPLNDTHNIMHDVVTFIDSMGASRHAVVARSALQQYKKSASDALDAIERMFDVLRMSAELMAQEHRGSGSRAKRRATRVRS